MRKLMVFLAVAALLFFSSPCLSQAPKQVAGFELGDNISVYKEKLNMRSALPIRYQEYLTEVEINRIEGYKSGLIAYATCKNPGMIVRIKLKYADSSKKFYEQLLKRFKKQFGEPTEWRGDPFHVMISWKWSFVDPKLNLISMILQHNTLDEDEKMGNSLKMTLTEQVGEERRCYVKKHPQSQEDKEKSNKRREKSVGNWERYLPQ